MNLEHYLHLTFPCFEPHMFVYVDETGSDKRSLLRKYGPPERVRQDLEPLDNSKLRWVRFRAAWVVRAITGGGNGANEMSKRIPPADKGQPVDPRGSPSTRSEEGE